MGPTVTSDQALELDAVSKAYFAQHPGAFEVIARMTQVARDVLGPGARLEFRMYHDPESELVTPHVYVKAGLSLHDTLQKIDEIISIVYADESLPEDFVGLLPAD